ncbi:MAG TPA: transglycosylase SLT domain-containing protein [Gemmatirosa sp.]
MLRSTTRAGRAFTSSLLTIGAVAASACASHREPLSVTLYGEAHVGRAPVSAFTNANGSPRFTRASDRDAFYTRIVPILERDAVNPRIQVDPNFVAALFIKESGLDSLAVSPVAALGIAQLTPRADADLRAMTTSPSFAWMATEVNGWPRDPAIHVDTTAPQISADSVRARLARGAVTSRTEYLFDPALSTRAAEYWIRLLQTKWTTDSWPGGYGSFANQKLAAGRPITSDQLFDLVAVSYNQGYVWTHDAVDRLGVDWVRRLPELGPAGVEASDYLARVRAYTVALQRGDYQQQYRTQRRRG